MKMTKTKSKLKVSQPTNSENPPSLTQEEIEQQFEVELCWCIQQLQTALRLGKLSPKQIQDNTKALNVLMSKTAPFVQKRQTMRLSFGDYRSKMEDKKLKKSSLQGKVVAKNPSKKSLFIKKSTEGSFKFNFQPLPQEQLPETAPTNVNTFNSVRAQSNGSFKFNFSMD